MTIQGTPLECLNNAQSLILNVLGYGVAAEPPDIGSCSSVYASGHPQTPKAAATPGNVSINDAATLYCTISSLPHPSVFEQRLKEIQGATSLRSQNDRQGAASWGGSSSDGVRYTNLDDRGFWPAHKPIPPEKHSRYSELMPNIHFLRRLEAEEAYQPVQVAPPSNPAPPPSNPPAVPPPIIQNSVPNSPVVLPTTTQTASTSDPVSSPPETQDSPPQLVPSDPALTSLKFMPTLISVPPADESASSPDTSSVPAATGPIRNVKEPRRPSLACTFCRERKIACGRPPPEAEDQTCDQCARRTFKCVYVKDKHRGRAKKHRR